MKAPTTPDNETQRLEALRRLNILDTPPEERFDRLTRLARRMFDVPIALVSLVDEDRQWFKSRAGLDATETSREISFCGHSILSGDIFMVPDTLSDDRFSDNPLVSGPPDIRFYAGCPLRCYPDGQRLGTLCLIDTKPRSLDQEDLAALKDLAELAERELVAFQLATLDDLTKVSNRRGFISLAQKSLNICARHQFPSALIFFDLDNFKPINDQFGHAEGDTALKVFSELMTQFFRDSDVYGRLGGDEFALLQTNTSYLAAEQSVARFQKLLDDYNLKANKPYDIAFSHGITMTDQSQSNFVDELLTKAGTIMYEKKKKK